MAVLRLATSRAAASLSPERQALAAAITAWRTAQDEAAAIDRAVDTARDAHSAASAKLEAAETAVTAAKTATADYLTASALGTPIAPPQTVKQARAALVDAEDDAEVAKASLDALRGRLETAQQHLEHCAMIREQAMKAMVQGSQETTALLAEIERLQTELVTKGAALLFLAKNNALDRSRAGAANYQGNNRVDITLMRLASPPNTWNALHNDLVPAGEGPYRSWLSALLTDATAPLPEIK